MLEMALVLDAGWAEWTFETDGQRRVVSLETYGSDTLTEFLDALLSLRDRDGTRCVRTSGSFGTNHGHVVELKLRHHDGAYGSRFEFSVYDCGDPNLLAERSAKQVQSARTQKFHYTGTEPELVTAIHAAFSTTDPDAWQPAWWHPYPDQQMQALRAWCDRT